MHRIRGTKRLRHELQQEIDAENSIRRTELRRRIRSSIVLHDACRQSDLGQFPANDPNATLRAALDTVAAYTGDGSPVAFTLNSNPSHIATWVALRIEERATQERTLAYRRWQEETPHVSDRVRVALNALPASHARDAFRALETLRALFLAP